MKDRLTFLHFLFIDTSIKELADYRVVNMENEYSRIIGATAKDRKESLTFIYNKYVGILPLEKPNKMKSNFTMKKA